MSDEPIRLLIVDDHTLFREGLEAIFLAASDMLVVGTASNGKDAIKQAQELTPDIILMDIQMGDLNGIEATKRILAHLPETKVIMLTMLEDRESLLAAMVAGAKGYVLKGADKAEVLKTIRAVVADEVLFGPTIAKQMTDIFQTFQLPVALTDKLTRQPFSDLTEREVEVLDLIARGRNNREIAGQLHIAVKTVSNHISNIFNKLQVADRAQAIVIAREVGLGKD